MRTSLSNPAPLLSTRLAGKAGQSNCEDASTERGHFPKPIDLTIEIASAGHS
jgi:hypothetical protein